MHKGFTLVEMIVAVGLFAMIMTTTTMLLFASLRSTRKASDALKAKSEGTYAMNVMTSLLRYATNPDCPNDQIINYTDSWGIPSSFEFVGGNLASGSAILTTNVTGKFYNCTTSSVNIDLTVNGNLLQSQVVLRNVQ